MRVIGVDPGSRVCGYGILDWNGSEITHIGSGCIVPDSSSPHPVRLKTIYDGLIDVIEKYSPDVMSIENIFFAKNAKSAIKLGQARGAALLAAANSGIEVHEYASTKVKLALTGRGRAKKADVQGMLSRLLGVSEWEREDASDAVAIAFCHINLSQTEKQLGEEFTKPRRRRRFTLDDLPS